MDGQTDGQILMPPGYRHRGTKSCQNSINIHSSSILNPHVDLQYVPNMSAKFEKHSLKTVRGVTTQTPYPTVQKRLPKTTKFKINYRAIKNPHIHLHYGNNKQVLRDCSPLSPNGKKDFFFGPKYINLVKSSGKKTNENGW